QISNLQHHLLAPIQEPLRRLSRVAGWQGRAEVSLRADRRRLTPPAARDHSSPHLRNCRRGSDSHRIPAASRQTPHFRQTTESPGYSAVSWRILDLLNRLGNLLLLIRLCIIAVLARQRHHLARHRVGPYRVASFSRSHHEAGCHQPALQLANLGRHFAWIPSVPPF